MPTVAVFDMTGKKTGEMELNEAVFGIEPNMAVVHAAVKNYLANQRQGTQSTLTRAEVRGGGIKPWRQKGTGRARQGSTRAPQWRKGGVVFAPKPRDYHQDVNKKLRRLAIKSALSGKVEAGTMTVLDSIAFEKPRTKDMAAVLNALEANCKTLLVLDAPDQTVELSARNLPGVKTIVCGTINVYDILNCEKMIVTKKAVETISEVYAK